MLLTTVLQLFQSFRTVNFIGDHENFTVPQSQTTLPLQVYSDIWHMKFSLPQGIDQFKANVGYIFGGQDVGEVLTKMSEVNPQARILFVDSDVELEAVWETYRMANVATFNSSLGSFCTFNPFKGSRLTCGGVDEVLEVLIGKFKDLNGYPIKVSIFEEVAICKKVGDRYIYQDGEVFHLLSRMLNFTAEYFTNPDNGRFGAKIGGQTFTGTLGDLYEGRAEVSAVSRIITISYETDFFTYLNLVSSLNLNFIAPKNFLQTEFNVFPEKFFDIGTNSLKLATILMISAIYFVSTHTKPFAKIFLSVISLLFNQQVKLPRTFRPRFLLLLLMLMSLTLNSAYQGLIITMLNARSNAADIRTIHQLLDNTKLTVYVEQGLTIFLEPFKTFEPNSESHKLYARHRVIDESTYKEEIACVLNRTCAFLCPAAYVESFKALHGDALFMVPETPFMYSLAPIIVKRSPFINRFNEILDRIVASGFVVHQVQNALHDAKLEYIKRVQGNGEMEMALLQLEHFKFTFFFYVGANLCAFVVFVVELRCKKV